MTSRGASSLAVQAFAWGGGALFAAAMATYVWFFAVTLATPGPPGVDVARATVWNVALFIVFAGHHSVMARSGAKAWLARVLPPALERSAYVWIASVLFLAVCLLWQRVPGVLYQVPSPASWFFVATQALGVVFTLAGARVLDALDLAGIRQARGPAGAAAIRVVWPFTVVRHPIYLGWALIVWGTPTMTVDRFVWALITTAYLVIAIPWEERSLCAVAGPAYLAYRRRVRWRMVPGVY